MWLTRQPREAVGADAPRSRSRPASSTSPARRRWPTAKRELAEEIGKQRRRGGEEIKAFYTSPGFSDERVWLYLATDLSDVAGAPRPTRTSGSRSCPGRSIGLDAAIAECEDSKSLIALLWLTRRLETG